MPSFHVAPVRSTGPLSHLRRRGRDRVGVVADFRRSIRQCLTRVSLQDGVANRRIGVNLEPVGRIATDSVGVRRVVSRL